jgi:hypothetical protein
MNLYVAQKKRMGVLTRLSGENKKRNRQALIVLACSSSCIAACTRLRRVSEIQITDYNLQLDNMEFPEVCNPCHAGSNMLKDLARVME